MIGQATLPPRRATLRTEPHGSVANRRERSSVKTKLAPWPTISAEARSTPTERPTRRGSALTANGIDCGASARCPRHQGGSARFRASLSNEWINASGKHVAARRRPGARYSSLCHEPARATRVSRESNITRLEASPSSRSRPSRTTTAPTRRPRSSAATALRRSRTLPERPSTSHPSPPREQCKAAVQAPRTLACPDPYAHVCPLRRGEPRRRA